MENAARSMKNLIVQFKGSEDVPMRELLILNKQLRNIRGSLKIETEKKVELQQCINQESISPRKYNTIQNMMMGFEKTSGSESKAQAH